MAITWQREAAGQRWTIRERQAGNSWNIFIKIGYVLLHQIDLILTISAVNAGLSELNPLIRSLLASPLQLVVVKLIIPVLIAWLVPSKLLLPAFALLSLVVIWNTKELLLLLF